MGLDTTHDCWHGPYSAFHRWRCAVARAAGIDLEKMQGFAEYRREVGIQWDDLKPDIIHTLLNHSDCDGKIEAKHCAALADRLEQLIPTITDANPIGVCDYHCEKTEQFVVGLRRAAKRKQSVSFH